MVECPSSFEVSILSSNNVIFEEKKICYTVPINVLY